MALVGRVGFNVNVIAQRTVRPVKEFNDAKAFIHGVEQKTITLPGLRQGVFGLPPRDAQALFKRSVFLLQSR